MKNKIILYLFINVCTVPAMKVMAQADISMATQWYNRANYNPASITRPDYIYLFSNVRKQWLGVNGSPSVFNVQASEYIHSLRSAFGISLVSDQIGATQSINPMLTYAYNIESDKDWSLSMGLSAGVFSRVIDGSLFELVNVSDPTIDYNYSQVLKPDANVGAEIRFKHFIFGLSSTHILSIAKDSLTFLNTNHQYGYAIYKNSDSELFNYHIGMQVVNRLSQTVFEVNSSIRFKSATGLRTGSREMFDIGLTYRTSNQMTVLFGINVSPDLRVGYAYDQSFSSGLSKAATHEIMIEYRIPSKAASTCIQCRNEDYWYY